jgi:hypothetical protein
LIDVVEYDRVMCFENLTVPQMKPPRNWLLRKFWEKGLYHPPLVVSIMSGASIGDIPVPGTDPYSEVLRITENYEPPEKGNCIRCGSPHITYYNQIMSSKNSDGLLSGDLSFKKLIVSKCLTCGRTIPIQFNLVREM